MAVKRERKVHSKTSDELMIENFVALQKVLTNLAIKMDGLSKQISKLLELFEISAQTFAKKDFETRGKNTEKIIEKVDNLLEQNKIIARGVSLLHEKEQNISQPSAFQSLPTSAQAPIQERQNVMQEEQKDINMGEYQKSISSRFKNLPTR